MQVRRVTGTLVGVVALSFTTFAGTNGFILISKSEYGSDQSARAVPASDGRTAGEVFDEQVWTRALDAPAIEVFAPRADGSIRPPIDIDVRFSAAPGATIDLSTLRIRYGLVGIDVTDRIRKEATVTQSGIRAEGAALPAGNHSMSIEIADNQGRKNRQTFKFRVEG